MPRMQWVINKHPPFRSQGKLRTLSEGRSAQDTRQMSEPLLEKIIAAIEKKWGVYHAPKPALAIYPLAGGNGSREKHAAELYLQGAAQQILLCSTTRQVQCHTIEVTRLVKEYLLAAGVPDDAFLVLSGRVRSTRDEAQLVAAYFRLRLEIGIHRTVPLRLLLVTDPYHSRRTLMTFRRALRGMPVEVLSSPCESELLVRTDWSPEMRLYFLLVEFLKTGYYALRGRLSF
jgi:uncharacterized SAM-binding protein YcdF (DUF218 family)